MLQPHQEPRSRAAPILLRGGHRDLEHARRLLDGQPSEEPQFDQSGGPRVGLGEFGEGVVKIYHAGDARFPSRDREGDGLPQPDPGAVARTAPLQSPPFPGVVLHDLAHRKGRDGQEVLPVGEAGCRGALGAAVGPDEFQVGLVHNQRRLQGAAVQMMRIRGRDGAQNRVARSRQIIG